MAKASLAKIRHYDGATFGKSKTAVWLANRLNTDATISSKNKTKIGRFLTHEAAFHFKNLDITNNRTYELCMNLLKLNFLERIDKTNYDISIKTAMNNLVVYYYKKGRKNHEEFYSF